MPPDDCKHNLICIIHVFCQNRAFPSQYERVTVHTLSRFREDPESTEKNAESCRLPDIHAQKTNINFAVQRNKGLIRNMELFC